MSLPHGHKLNNEEIKKNLLVFINGFKAALNLSDIEMANYLCLTGAAYKKMVNGKLNIPLVPVYEILEKHNLCFESILHNSVDYKVLAQNAQGINYNLPERYQHLANSSRRSSLYMLDYIGQRYGQLNRLSSDWREMKNDIL